MTHPVGEDLLSRLQREADAAVAACAMTADAQAVALREAAERDAEIRRHAALTIRAQAHEHAQAAAKAVAQQAAVRDTLQAREEAVTRVLDAVVVASNALSTHPDLAGLLHADITRAIPCLPDGPVTVRCPPSIERVTREAAAQIDAVRTTVMVDPSMTLGIIAQSSDGRVEVNATMARRISSERPRLAIRIARLLAESFA
ncbi:MAG: hypothetical protein IPP90_15185 [Gemmatimonadaceae bacterium]|nr:hypothetical protein [Gemmatimonadaceae bacterium]